MFNKTLLALAVAALTTTASAQNQNQQGTDSTQPQSQNQTAQSSDMPSTKHQEQVLAEGKQRFEELDKNADKRLSKDEVKDDEELSTSFAGIDVNTDDQIDEDEYATYTLAERMNQQNQQHNQGQMAQSNDSYSSQSQQQQMADNQKRFKELDKDGDGQLSKEEVKDDEKLSSGFADADADTDDKINEDEFAAYQVKNQDSQQ